MIFALDIGAKEPAPASVCFCLRVIREFFPPFTQFADLDPSWPSRDHLASLSSFLAIVFISRSTIIQICLSVSPGSTAGKHLTIHCDKEIVQMSAWPRMLLI